MAYITNANFRRITRELKAPRDKNFKFDDIIIWESPNGKVIDKNNPSIFGWWEVNDLLAFKEFCKDAKNLRKNGRMRAKCDKWLVHIPFLCYLTILLNLAEGAVYGGY